jgi:serine/threonine protein kinase
MTREHWLRIKEITAEALDLEPGERAVYITEACGQDPDVLSEVLRLVREADASGQEFLESPSWSPRAFLTRKFEMDERPVQVPQRFEILREAGRGGMGMVFECLDRERNLRVALKTLTRVSPLRLYSFKQEFRGLAGITHPNLVCLYEFLQEERRYFLSMEFVEGVGFLEYAGGRHFGRLRAVLPQIVSGLFTIHAAGKLHRDLKPSNVMITASGRAVILDFGLVAEQRRELFGVQRGGPIGGTLS